MGCITSQPGNKKPYRYGGYKGRPKYGGRGGHGVGYAAGVGVFGSSDYDHHHGSSNGFDYSGGGDCGGGGYSHSGGGDYGGGSSFGGGCDSGGGGGGGCDSGGGGGCD